MVFVDSDWGGDTSHRKSISGSTFFLAGAPIMYKTKMQPTVAMSSTEAEFVAASETGKMVLYIRSILDALGLCIQDATPMHIDNAGARQMANAQKPTRRTRHLDIRYFALTGFGLYTRFISMVLLTRIYLGQSRFQIDSYLEKKIIYK